MPSDKYPHGTTFQQSVILAILAKDGPLMSSEIADLYKKTTKIDVAYNYQYIITRRMASRGLIRSQAPGDRRTSQVFRWVITPKGKKLLANVKRLAKVLTQVG